MARTVRVVQPRVEMAPVYEQLFGVYRQLYPALRTVFADLAAVAEAKALLAIDGVVGVNLSGLASGRGERFAAEIKAAVGQEIRGDR